MKRQSIKIIGSFGVLSCGTILSKIIVDSGFFLKSEREFPSLIKGGEHSFLIDFSSEEIFSNSKRFDYLCDLDKSEIIFKGKKVVNNDENTKVLNSFIVGAMVKLLNFDIKGSLKVLNNFFRDKNSKENEKAFMNGFNSVKTKQKLFCGGKCLNAQKQSLKKTLINGNEAIALGAMNSGLELYFSYPMSPATSVSDYLPDNKILKLLNNDEISAVSMCLGAMYAGKNAMTATSSGGFDLMTETISASAMMEIPLVVVLSQRPGPGTGLPTWDSQDNINLAIFGGHGDYPKAVLAVSDADSGINILTSAFKIAKNHQVPVIVLTQKSISESYYVLNKKYKKEITPFAKTVKIVNADEHNESGIALNAGKDVEKAVVKRMSKLKNMQKDLPKAFSYGEKNAELSFVCYGSSKGAIVDAINNYEGKKINMLNLETLWPIDKIALKKFFSENKKVVMVEQNFSGQMRRIIEGETNHKFWKSLNKFDGKAFSFEDIIKFINENI